MQLPYFYEENLTTKSAERTLCEATARHVVQVLRMKPGELLQLTNGSGLLCTAEIISADKKLAIVKILKEETFSPAKQIICLAISPTKNSSRIEWLLEKVTEIGIQKIVLMQCARTEKTHLNVDRMHNILVSAMIQSRQVFLPHLEINIPFSQVVTSGFSGKKLIAHCEEAQVRQSITGNQNTLNKLILIGPEGDFSNSEIEFALENKFIPVTLGTTRLRTETAGLVAAVLLKNT